MEISYSSTDLDDSSTAVPLRASPMMFTFTPPKQGGPSWTRRLEQRYALRIDQPLADWFDGEAWQQIGNNEFNQTISPQILLADTPDVIWPGLMLPDTLPLLGNRDGDWLCLRVGPDDAVSEIIHWYHGGGDWIPWGKTLAEAIAFDAIRHSLPGRHQGHSVPAEPRRRGDSNGALARWAARWLPAEVGAVIRRDSDRPVAAVLLEHRVAEIALRCEMVLAALDSDLRRALSPEIAAELGVEWEPRAVSWLFDTSRIDADLRSALRQKVGPQVDWGQDWLSAAEQATAVCDQRNDLGWAFDVAGWAAEREGDVAGAVRLYRKGVKSLAFADQSIRFRTHWFPQRMGKFSTWRLHELEAVSDTPTDPVDRYLAAIRQADARTLRSQALGYWRSVAERAAASARWADAYDAHYRSGWDLGLDDMREYRQRLAGLVEAAERAGQRARAAVARAHLDTFASRFG